MALVGSDSEIEMPSVAGQPIRDALGPFDGGDPRSDKKVLEHEAVDWSRPLEPVGVEMEERARPLVEGVEIESWACNRIVNTQTKGKSLHKGGLAHAKIAVEGENGVVGQGGGQGLSCGAGSVGIGRRETGPEIIADARIHGRQ